MSDTSNDTKDIVTVERTISAPAEAIFALLVDPSRHRDIDGSGTVRDVRGESPRLTLSSVFGMSMKRGIPYSMVSTVVEYEENRLLAWQTRGPGRIGKHVGGRIWRYQLEPVDGGIRVRETWDLTHESALTKPFARKGAADARRNMTATLERIEGIVAATS